MYITLGIDSRLDSHSEAKVDVAPADVAIELLRTKADVAPADVAIELRRNSLIDFTIAHNVPAI
jgi:hypothetical protein